MKGTGYAEKLKAPDTLFFFLFFLFFFAGQAEQQGADIPRWFYRIGSTNKLRIAVALSVIRARR